MFRVGGCGLRVTGCVASRTSVVRGRRFEANDFLVQTQFSTVQRSIALRAYLLSATNPKSLFLLFLSLIFCLQPHTSIGRRPVAFSLEAFFLSAFPIPPSEFRLCLHRPKAQCLCPSVWVCLPCGMFTPPAQLNAEPIYPG